MRIPSPLTLFVTGLVLLVATAGILWIVPSDYYVFLPDNAKPVAPLVTVKGGKDPTGQGGVYYDAVIVRRAKLFEQLFHFVHDGETLVKAEQVNPPGASDQQARLENLREMATSQQIAGAVALRYLGYKVEVEPRGALIEQVADGSPAAKAHLEPTEIIEAIDGKRVRTIGDVRRLMAAHRPGDKVRLTIRTGKELENKTVATVEGCTVRPGDAHCVPDPKRAILGVVVKTAAQIQLPIPVQIDAGSIGGPSAGLAFALDVLEELGHDVTRGYKVAATGELDTDGSVEPIGGVKQKAIGVRRAGVDVFLVPAGDNAKEARKWAGPVRVIPVESFRQALRALATLPPKR
ncbi:MAG TPA: PDZ domain-containing protein [Gaiellaceae bacterium]